MKNFSERLGYIPTNAIQYEFVNETLRNRIWNLFYLSDIQRGGLGSKRMQKALAGQPSIEELVIDKLGFSLPCAEIKLENNKLKFLQEHLLECPWNEVYEFVEAHIASVDEAEREERIQEYNLLFESEKSGYRFVNGIIAPITNQEEVDALEKAGKTAFDPVNTHICKAIAFYSDIASPDYENCIKESISAVESMCCIITGLTGKQATLGNAIKKLKESGVYIHPAMERAFEALYGYTSDENGIRHGGMDFRKAPSEDAKYMLVSCSAFINFLIEKWGKEQNQRTQE